ARHAAARRVARGLRHRDHFELLLPPGGLPGVRRDRLQARRRRQAARGPRPVPVSARGQAMTRAPAKDDASVKPPAPMTARAVPAFLSAVALLAGAAFAEFSPLSIHPEGFGMPIAGMGSRERALGEAGAASATAGGFHAANPA